MINNEGTDKSFEISWLDRVINQTSIMDILPCDCIFKNIDWEVCNETV